MNIKKSVFSPFDSHYGTTIFLLVEIKNIQKEALEKRHLQAVGRSLSFTPSSTSSRRRRTRRSMQISLKQSGGGGIEPAGVQGLSLGTAGRRRRTSS